MSFQNKYLKYKNKYLDLKKQFGGQHLNIRLIYLDNTYNKEPIIKELINIDVNKSSKSLAQMYLEELANIYDLYDTKINHIVVDDEIVDGDNLLETVFSHHDNNEILVMHILYTHKQPPQTLGHNRNEDPTLGHTDTVLSLAVIGDRIISGSRDRTIKIWAPNDQGEYTCTQTLGHTNTAMSVAVIGDRIISGGQDHTIKIWARNDQDQYTCTQTLGVDYNEEPELGHTNGVNSVAVIGDRIISGSQDRTIKIWAPNQQREYTCTQTLGLNVNDVPEFGHIGWVSSVAVIGERIISGSQDRTIKIWAPNQQREYTCTQTLGHDYNQEPELGHTGGVWSVVVIGDRIISGSQDRTIKIWAPNQQGEYTCTQTLGVNYNHVPALGHISGVNSVAVIGDRIISGSQDRTIKIWGLDQQGEYTCIQTLGLNHNEDPKLGHTDVVWEVVVIGDRIISGSQDRTIKIWNMPPQ
jgi:WD40 repeat protein